MVQVGDQIYHWRYGPLEVTRLDAEYIYTDIVDKEGIVNAGNAWDAYLREPEKVFVLKSLGYWVYDNGRDAAAAFKNFEKLDFINQGQEPKAMEPINEKLFHRFFPPFLRKDKAELEKKYAEYQDRLQNIEGVNKEYKNEYKKVFAELFSLGFQEVLKKLFNACPFKQEMEDGYKNNEGLGERNIEALVRSDVVEWFFKIQPEKDFSIHDCISEVIAGGKSKLPNDADYKEYTSMVERQVQAVYVELKEFHVPKDISKYLLDNNLSKVEFQSHDWISEIMAEGKSRFTNEADYKEYTSMVEKQAQVVRTEIKVSEDKAYKLKETAKRIKDSKKINGLIDDQDIYNLDKGLPDKIERILDDEMDSEKFEYEGKRKKVRIELDDSTA